MKKEKKDKTAPEKEETVKAEEAEAETAGAAEEAQPQKEASETEKLEEELKAEKEKYIRLYAEYDNYRKRTASEKAQTYNNATADAVKELLPLADSMTQALAQFEGKEVPEEFKKGVEMIGQQLARCFEKLKVEPFCEVGDPFDPELHNAVSMIEDENLPENSVSAVYQKGYRLGDKIIRHAMVVVANA